MTTVSRSGRDGGGHWLLFRLPDGADSGQAAGFLLGSSGPGPVPGVGKFGGSGSADTGTATERLARIPGVWVRVDPAPP
jgi:hypothetical protein